MKVQESNYSFKQEEIDLEKTKNRNLKKTITDSSSLSDDNDSLSPSSESEIESDNRSYTVDFKLKVIEYYDKEENKKKTAKKFGIHRRRVQKWVKQREQLSQVPLRDRKSVRTLKQGSFDILYFDLFVAFYLWIKSEWEEGRFLTSSQVIGFFIEEDEELMDKTYRQLIDIGFRQKFNLCLRKPLKQVQYDSDIDLENSEDNFHFDLVTQLDHIKFHPFSIYNMDQVSVYFENRPDRVIAKKGQKDARVETKNQEKNRITAIFLVRRDGQKYPPFFIFKGIKNARIHKEVRTFNSKEVNNTVQVNAWTDTEVLLEWIDYFQKNVDMNTPFILLADSYSLHLQQFPDKLDNEQKSQRVHFIPPYLTPKNQPLDVGVNHSFKSILRKKWSSQQDKDLLNRQDLIQDILESWKEVSEQTIINSFLHELPYLDDFL